MDNDFGALLFHRRAQRGAVLHFRTFCLCLLLHVSLPWLLAFPMGLSGRIVGRVGLLFVL